MATERSAASPLAMPDYDFPGGLTVTRDPWRISDLRWLVHDPKTGLGEVVVINPSNYEVPWEPPPKAKWWRWLSPLGATLRELDRAHEMRLMHGKMVVDWFAVDTAIKKEIGDAIKRLLDQREHVHAHA